MGGYDPLFGGESFWFDVGGIAVVVLVFLGVVLSEKSIDRFWKK